MGHATLLRAMVGCALRSEHWPRQCSRRLVTIAHQARDPAQSTSSLQIGRHPGRRQPCACGTELMQPSGWPWLLADLPLQNKQALVQQDTKIGKMKPCWLSRTHRQAKAGQEDQAICFLGMKRRSMLSMAMSAAAFRFAMTTG